jgi:molecular chaperone DnaJ
MRFGIQAHDVDVPYLAEKLIERKVHKVENQLRRYKPETASLHAGLLSNNKTGTYQMKLSLHLAGATLTASAKHQTIIGACGAAFAKLFRSVEEFKSALRGESHRKEKREKAAQVGALGYDKSLRPAYREDLFREVTEETIRRRPGVEPLEPVANAASDILLSRSFQTFHPSFDEIFDRLWSNFSSMQRPKAEIRRPLTAEVVITPRQARRGGRIRVFVPAAEATCPTCRERGGTGPWECWRCAGEGSITGELPIIIEYPEGLTDGHIAMVSLEHLGIRNLYLTVRFRVSGG